MNVIQKKISISFTLILYKGKARKNLNFLTKYFYHNNCSQEQARNNPYWMLIVHQTYRDYLILQKNSKEKAKKRVQLTIKFSRMGKYKIQIWLSDQLLNF